MVHFNAGQPQTNSAGKKIKRAFKINDIKQYVLKYV